MLSKWKKKKMAQRTSSHVESAARLDETILHNNWRLKATILIGKVCGNRSIISAGKSVHRKLNTNVVVEQMTSSIRSKSKQNLTELRVVRRVFVNGVILRHVIFRWSNVGIKKYISADYRVIIIMIKAIIIIIIISREI